MKSECLNYTQIQPGMSVEEISDIVIENVKILETLYPKDIPNDLCNTAILSGIFYENSEIDKNVRFEHLLSTQNEEIYVWNEGSNRFRFVSKVESRVKELNIWDTFGLLLSLSFAWNNSFEHSIDDICYNWVYRFDANQNISELDYYENDSAFYINDGVFLTKLDLQRMLRLVALLIKDKTCLSSLINFNSSMQLSYCCLICELTFSGPKMHSSHEPQIWEKLSLVNNFETAILLAYKSVEHSLGKPSKNKKLDKIKEFKVKWRNKLNMDPDSIYEKNSKTYFDYYIYLLSLRNSSAHADFKNSFELQRKTAIEAQCFAAIILINYINTNLPSFEETTKELKINSSLF